MPQKRRKRRTTAEKWKDATTEDLLKEFFYRDGLQQLPGQTSLKHYRETLGKHDTCECCQQKKNLHRHRIIPKQQNGLYVDENIYWCCALCHKLIHKIYNETGANDKLNYKLAIMIAEDIARKRIRDEE